MYPMSIPELRSLCVDSFPSSKTRVDIMHGLAKVVSALEEAELFGELWIDGSFLTEKVDPRDVDLSLRISSEAYEHGTEKQRAAIDWVSSNLRSQLKCDSYVFMEYAADDPLFWHGEYMYSYWMRQWGFSRDERTMKGFVVYALDGNARRRAFRAFMDWHNRQLLENDRGLRAARE